MTDRSILRSGSALRHHVAEGAHRRASDHARVRRSTTGFDFASDIDHSFRAALRGRYGVKIGRFSQERNKHVICYQGVIPEFQPLLRSHGAMGRTWEARGLSFRQACCLSRVGQTQMGSRGR